MNKEEIEIGEYVRTTDSEIEKVVLIYDNRYMNEDGNMTYFDEIKNHSKSIIDLIEKGDYVNGMRVIATENRGRYNEEKQKDEKVILAENYDEWTENGVISNEDINTIVTKERFNNIIYKVVE